MGPIHPNPCHCPLERTALVTDLQSGDDPDERHILYRHQTWGERHPQSDHLVVDHRIEMEGTTGGGAVAAATRCVPERQ